MSSRVLRLEPIPTASDPAVLIRVLRAIAAGERSPAQLAETLEMGLPALLPYLDAAVWLGLVAKGGEPRLSSRGLDVASADPRRRRRLLAAAIWHAPEPAEILRGVGPLLLQARVAAWLRERQPTLQPERLARLSEAAASLLAPALEFPEERHQRTDQLTLPFQAPRPPAPGEQPPQPGVPAVERVRVALLDEGELTLDEVAALAEGPAGGVADALLRQGLAERVGDALVGTAALAGAEGGALPETRRPFLEELAVPRLGVAFPSSLAALRDGLAPVNAALRRARELPPGTPPAATDPRRRVHGGLLHPGERPPRAVPDALSLRLRALQNAPAFALLGALLLLDRRAEGRLTIRADGSAVRWRRRLVGTLAETLAAFARARGWVVLRPDPPLLSAESWIEAAQGLGLARRAERRLTLEETLFVRLQEDVEASLTLEALEPLVTGLESWLELARREG